MVRWDHLITIYRAFLHLACLLITCSGYETSSMVYKPHEYVCAP